MYADVYLYVYVCIYTCIHIYGEGLLVLFSGAYGALPVGGGALGWPWGAQGALGAALEPPAAFAMSMGDFHFSWVVIVIFD